jgi:hypothetical protein
MEPHKWVFEGMVMGRLISGSEGQMCVKEANVSFIPYADRAVLSVLIRESHRQAIIVNMQ